MTTIIQARRNSEEPYWYDLLTNPTEEQLRGIKTDNAQLGWRKYRVVEVQR